MLFAIHIITEGSDHYNMIVDAATDSDLIDQIKQNMYGDFNNISEVWVSDTRGHCRDTETYIMVKSNEEYEIIN